MEREKFYPEMGSEFKERTLKEDKKIDQEAAKRYQETKFAKFSGERWDSSRNPEYRKAMEESFEDLSKQVRNLDERFLKKEINFNDYQKGMILLDRTGEKIVDGIREDHGGIMVSVAERMAKNRLGDLWDPMKLYFKPDKPLKPEEANKFYALRKARNKILKNEIKNLDAMTQGIITMKDKGKLLTRKERYEELLKSKESEDILTQYQKKLIQEGNIEGAKQLTELKHKMREKKEE